MEILLTQFFIDIFYIFQFLYKANFNFKFVSTTFYDLY